jgi:hypothetical protein
MIGGFQQREILGRVAAGVHAIEIIQCISLGYATRLFVVQALRTVLAPGQRTVHDFESGTDRVEPMRSAPMRKIDIECIRDHRHGKEINAFRYRITAVSCLLRRTRRNGQFVSSA